MTKILMYHSIPRARSGSRFAVSVSRFRAQMDWLRQAGWQGVSVEAALAKRAVDDTRVVALTFDDGYEDFFTNAFPILSAHGFSATVFLPTGRVGGTNTWEAEGTPVKRLLTWDEVGEMSRARVELGSHMVSHLDVRRASVEEMADELTQSKSEIQQRVGVEVVSFAYPYGYYRSELPGLLRAAGYKYGLLAGTYGRNAVATPPYELHRVPIWGGDSLAQFAAKVRGWYWWRYYTSRADVEARWALRQLSRGQHIGR